MSTNIQTRTGSPARRTECSHCGDRGHTAVEEVRPAAAAQNPATERRTASELPAKNVKGCCCGG